jgi:uncharacterized membrane protein
MDIAFNGNRVPFERVIREVTVDRSSRWLAAGWWDMWRMPGISLGYGAAFVAAGYVLAFLFMGAGMGSLILPLAGGFALLAPFLAVGLYEVSRRLEAGQPVTLGDTLRACLRNEQVSNMGVVLVLFFFIWILLALVLFAATYHKPPPPLERFLIDVVFSLDGLPFIALGTLVGALLATAVFAVSAVSLPLLLDRDDVDVVTAMTISIAAVRRNWQVMFGWAAMIALITFVGLATFLLGLAVALPLVGHATWHAYRDIIARP